MGMSKKNKTCRSMEQLRNDIMTAANIYSGLASKRFMYVYGSKFFEMSFPTRCFRHLCGVSSKLSAERFYSNAKNMLLDIAQLEFDVQRGQSIRTAKKKLIVSRTS